MMSDPYGPVNTSTLASDVVSEASSPVWPNGAADTAVAGAVPFSVGPRVFVGVPSTAASAAGSRVAEPSAVAGRGRQKLGHGLSAPLLQARPCLPLGPAGELFCEEVDDHESTISRVTASVADLAGIRDMHVRHVAPATLGEHKGEAPNSAQGRERHIGGRHGLWREVRSGQEPEATNASASPGASRPMQWWCNTAPHCAKTRVAKSGNPRRGDGDAALGDDCEVRELVISQITVAQMCERLSFSGSSRGTSTSAGSSAEQGGERPDARTTVMLQRISYELDEDGVRSILDQHGLARTYDSVHVPRNPKRNVNLGYGFVNFLCPAKAAACTLAFSGRPFGGGDPPRICSVAYSKTQGVSFIEERIAATVQRRDGAQHSAAATTIFQ